MLALFAATLFLLPWSWFPPFPWLHEHAQWSDIAFALTFALWLAEKLRKGHWPRPSLFHLAIVCYVASATLSLILSPNSGRGGFWKLLGICELACLAVVTADLVSQPEIRRLAVRAIAVTAVLSATAGIAGLFLFYAGDETRLVGPYGDLAASVWYARIKAGTTHPNMLASFCIFASAITASGSNIISARLRRIVQSALAVTVLLTFSRGILAFFLAMAIRHAHTRRQRQILISAVCAYIAVIAVLTVSYLSLNPARPLEAHFIRDVPSARKEALTSSLRTLAAHPFSGIGIGSSPGTRAGQPFDAHMTLVNIAATMGLPALLSFLGIFLALWRHRQKPMDQANIALWSGLAGLMLDGLAQDVEDFRHLWVLIGFTAGIGNGVGRTSVIRETTETTDTTEDTG